MKNRSKRIQEELERKDKSESKNKIENVVFKVKENWEEVIDRNTPNNMVNNVLYRPYYILHSLYLSWEYRNGTGDVIYQSNNEIKYIPPNKTWKNIKVSTETTAIQTK